MVGIGRLFKKFRVLHGKLPVTITDASPRQGGAAVGGKELHDFTESGDGELEFLERLSGIGRFLHENVAEGKECFGSQAGRTIRVVRKFETIIVRRFEVLARRGSAR